MPSSMQRPRIGVGLKLSSVLGAAVLALCVMGFSAIYAVREIQGLEADILAESGRLTSLETDIAVGIESAVGMVNAAPSELDLPKLKIIQERFQSLLDASRAALHDKLTGLNQAEVRASVATIQAAVGGFQTASLVVFEKASAFAQPEAIEALRDGVAPAELALRDALKRFSKAISSNSAAKAAAIDATIASVTSAVASLVVAAIQIGRAHV